MDWPTLVFQFPVRDFRLEIQMNSLTNLALLLWTLDSHQSFIISSYFEDVKIIFSIYEVLHGTVLVRHGHHAGKILEKGREN